MSFRVIQQGFLLSVKVIYKATSTPACIDLSWNKFQWNEQPANSVRREPFIIFILFLFCLFLSYSRYELLKLDKMREKIRKWMYYKATALSSFLIFRENSLRSIFFFFFCIQNFRLKHPRNSAFSMGNSFPIH